MRRYAHSGRKTQGCRLSACLMVVSLSPANSFSPILRHQSHERYPMHHRQYHSHSPYPSGRRRSSHLPVASEQSSSADSTNANGANGYEWKVGNVYDDLDTLRREIAITQADQHLRQVEDRERLDTFAKQRRPIQADVRRFILVPFAVSVLLTIMSKSHRFCRFSRFCNVSFDVYLLMGMVLAPVWLLWGKRRSLPAPKPPPSDLRGLDPEYYRFVVTDWEDPKTSCRDHVLCILENWTSAVVGPAILLGWLYWSGATSMQRCSVRLAVALSTLVIRLGALASLYQYPKLLFQLQRRHQPRPMDRYTLRLRQLVCLTLALAPWGVASDFSKIMALLPTRAVSSCLAMGLVGYCKYKIQKIGARPWTRRDARRQGLTWRLLTLTQLASLWNLVTSIPWRRLNVNWLTKAPSKTVPFMVSLWSFLLLGPICHLMAVRKLVRVNYTHNLSLANDYDTISTILSDPVERTKRFKWRYRLEWREPERILETISNWKGGFWYWLLFQGGVEDQLRREFQSSQKTGAYRQGLTVLQRCQDEMTDNPETPRPDSRLWKQRAMEVFAKKHEQDYQSGTFEDPLGVAIQQTFGIGLGFQFDHMVDLKEGERLTARRLQARAAKSAIRRAQELYDAAAARKEVAAIIDPEEKARLQAAMRQASDAEMAYLASALSELVPTGQLVDTERKTRIQQFVQRGFKRSSNHEMILGSPYEASTSVNSLLGKPDESLPDEEFVEAWLKRQQEDDEDDSTVLV